MSRAQLVPIVLGVWTVQLIGSVLWTQRFRQGPLEWLWHRIVYGLLGFGLEPSQVRSGRP